MKGMLKYKVSTVLSLFLFISIVLVSFPASSQAQTVTNLNDAGAGSLRAAIAGAAPGATINFNPSLTGGTITLLTEIVINKNLTINGLGADNLTISGGDSTRIFRTDGAASNVVISDLRLANGFVNDNGAALFIGANNSVTEIHNCVIEFNSTSCIGVNCNGAGAGINVPGAVQDVIIYSSSFSFNSSTCTGVDCDGNGAAIKISGGAQTLEVHSTTFDNNSSSCVGVDCNGNGAAFSHTGGTFSGNFTNCTFAFNSSTCIGVDCNGAGGAISQTGGGPFDISFSTFDSNTSSCTRNGCLQGGANLSILGTEVRIGSSIFKTDSPNGNCGGSDPVSLGFNIDTDGTCIDGSAPGDKPNTNPLLDPNGLQDNGGPTQTIALLANSPAIDMADPACPPPFTDQRGFPRPAPEGTRCDIGAFEGSIQATNVPTLSEWGLVAMAGILGIVGFMVIRRRKVTA